jgi:hypothetical protein
MLFSLVFASGIAGTTKSGKERGGDSRMYGGKLGKEINTRDKRRMKSKRRHKERNVDDLNAIKE